MARQEVRLHKYLSAYGASPRYHRDRREPRRDARLPDLERGLRACGSARRESLRKRRVPAEAGGVLVLTVPYGLAANTVEHFPDLGDYEIVSDEEGEPVLETSTRDGSVVRYRNLVFHGGDGATLEMRSFALASLETHLREAGFHPVEVLGDEPRYGIVWPEDWSRPILAIAH